MDSFLLAYQSNQNLPIPVELEDTTYIEWNYTGLNNKIYIPNFTLLTELDITAPNITSIQINTTSVNDLKLYDTQIRTFVVPSNITAILINRGSLDNIICHKDITKVEILNTNLKRFVACAGMKEIRHLVLSYNKLNLIDIRPCTKIATLFFRFNKNLSRVLFPEHMYFLRNMAFSCCNLKSLDLNIMPNIERVYGANNGLKYVSVPASLPLIAYIDLENNEIEELLLPNDATGLVHINLNYNKLTSFTLQPGWTLLKHIALAYNNLTTFTVPATIDDLVFVALSYNKLAQYTCSGNGDNIDWLDISHNEFTDQSQIVLNGNDYVHINLSHNHLTTYTTPANFSSIQLFAISHNDLETLNINTLGTGLKHLDVSNNNLSTLDVDKFINLEVLMVGNNPNLDTLSFESVNHVDVFE